MLQKSTNSLYRKFRRFRRTTPITAQLGKQHRSALDSLLISEGEQPSRLAWLLQPPGKINGKNVLQHIDRLNSITALELPDGIELCVHQNKLLKLARKGRKMSSRDLAKFTNIRRYATLVCVIQEARATLTDEVIELHERIMGGLFSQAKRKQAERLQLTGKLIQSKLKQYVTVGQALLHARKSGEDPWAAIEDVIPWQEFVNSLEDSTHVLDGLLYHESDLEITEHYTDTAGFTEHVFALMHLLGFAFAPRIRDLHDKRLFIQGKAERYPGLQSVISTTSLNIKDIETYWDEVLRLAASIKQGTVTASLMMKKLASYPKQNGLAKALREIGRIERTLFMLDLNSSRRRPFEKHLSSAIACARLVTS